MTPPREVDPIRRLGRVPGFDGVRAIAVLLVIWSHIGILHAIPGGFKPKGGFLGVDVFFVLSGFLITALLLGEQGVAGRVRFAAFYRRRALRLLPVIFAFLTAHVVFTQYVLHTPAKVERESIPAAVLFFTNWRAVYSQLPVAFGHLWSLAVEEQFYIVWPFVMTLLSARARLRTVMAVLGSALLGVALLRAWMWQGDTSNARLLLGTDTHSDGIIAGALLAHLWVRQRVPRRGVRLAASCGAVFVLSSTFLLDSTSPFLYLGGFTLIAACVAAVLLAVVDTAWAGVRLLELAPLRAIGRVSYGLYMWHPLVFWWVWHETWSWGKSPRLLTALLLTATVTAVSWFAIEQPFLRWKDRLEARGTVPPSRTVSL